MATQVPPKRGVAFTYELCLVSQADSALFQVNPTLAAGDVVIYKDGVLDGNADNIPTAVGASSLVTHTLSATEMTADRITVRFSDQAGAEWQDLVVNIHTVTTSQIDDIDGVPAAVLAAVVENSKTVQDFLRIIKAAVAGKASGGGTTTIVFRDDADSKARITATVDANGNRTAVTLDPA
jgi:hypothetical protein